MSSSLETLSSPRGESVPRVPISDIRARNPSLAPVIDAILAESGVCRDGGFGGKILRFDEATLLREVAKRSGNSAESRPHPPAVTDATSAE